MYQDKKVMKNSKVMLKVLFLMKEFNYYGLCIFRMGIRQLGIFSVLNHDALLKRSYFLDFFHERNFQPMFLIILKLMHILFDDNFKLIFA